MHFPHLPTALTRHPSSDSLGRRKSTPWIASPLAAGNKESEAELEHHQSTDRVVAFEEGQHAELQKTRSEGDHPIFREHHETTTVELFFDLFFVANLATFTANHEIVDTASLKNYLGFFTLLWFTWLQYSLFDVRFSTDSVFNRICKAVSFGIMTGFAVCGAIYDTTNLSENASAFKAMALILMVSRLALIGQYGIVLFYVRKYKQTTMPLLLTMLALFVGAMVYLGTYFGFPKSSIGDSFPIQHNSSTYAAWYTLACVEALAVISISCYWRVVSFRHTHLVERIGLLTLIIMGEGIIGMTKSVSTILQTSASVSSSDIGTVTASVLLIYFIWVLYFDQIEHDRFGTIRQQIWAILHYPLHVAILLTVEGSTALILWNIIKTLSVQLQYDLPCPGFNYVNEASFGYPDVGSLVNYFNQTIIAFNDNFRNSNVSASYDYNADLIALTEIKAPYNSTDWYNEAADLECKILFGVSDFLYAQFHIEAPGSETAALTGGSAADELTAKYDEFAKLFNVFNTVFYYFYIAAGAFLIVLAVMYWFGKTHKSRNEYLSMAMRAVAGAALMVGLISGTYLPIAIPFDYSAWFIPTVTLSYFVVIIVDGLLVWHSNSTIGRQTTRNPHERFSRVDGSVEVKRSGSGSGTTTEHETDRMV